MIVLVSSYGIGGGAGPNCSRKFLKNVSHNLLTLDRLNFGILIAAWRNPWKIYCYVLME